MEKKKNNKRRQFLKNTSLAILGVGVIPNLLKANSPEDDSALACDPTTLDYYGEGPFYTANPPVISAGQLAGSTEVGTRIVISGRVRNLDCSKVIPNTIVDVWHANNAGQYDNTTYNLRGKTTSNNQGFYIFETVKPGKYLNGSQYRPSHIHFKITPPGFSLLTTQLYFTGDTSIPADAAASITSGTYNATHRIIPLTLNSTTGNMEGTWDIVINGNGVIVGTNDLHIDRGMIYKVSPNPFVNKVTIQYGVFNKAKVNVLVYDVQGMLVANLEEKTLEAEKYEAEWSPAPELQNGHYFIALKINEIQVHYQKVILQR